MTFHWLALVEGVPHTSYLFWGYCIFFFCSNTIVGCCGSEISHVWWGSTAISLSATTYRMPRVIAIWLRNSDLIWGHHKKVVLGLVNWLPTWLLFHEQNMDPFSLWMIILQRHLSPSHHFSSDVRCLAWLFDPATIHHPFFSIPSSATSRSTLPSQGVKQTAPWAKRCALESAVALIAGLNPEAGPADLRWKVVGWSWSFPNEEFSTTLKTKITKMLKPFFWS